LTYLEYQNGFNGKLLPDRWKDFGPAIRAEVTAFFQRGSMSSLVARSNLILIPKTESASQVSHFRPISVYNVTYKLSLKFCQTEWDLSSHHWSLTLNALSSHHWYDISENVILFKEVLHSFKQKDYKNSEFCLKVNLAKAFDRLDWDYIREFLPLYGFPGRRKYRYRPWPIWYWSDTADSAFFVQFLPFWSDIGHYST